MSQVTNETNRIPQVCFIRSPLQWLGRFHYQISDDKPSRYWLETAGSIPGRRLKGPKKMYSLMNWVIGGPLLLGFDELYHRYHPNSMQLGSNLDDPAYHAPLRSLWSTVIQS